MSGRGRIEVAVHKETYLIKTAGEWRWWLMRLNIQLNLTELFEKKQAALLGNGRWGKKIECTWNFLLKYKCHCNECIFYYELLWIWGFTTFEWSLCESNVLKDYLIKSCLESHLYLPSSNIFYAFYLTFLQLIFTTRENECHMTSPFPSAVLHSFSDSAFSSVILSGLFSLLPALLVPQSHPSSWCSWHLYLLTLHSNLLPVSHHNINKYTSLT